MLIIVNAAPLVKEFFPLQNVLLRRGLSEQNSHRLGEDE